MSIINLLIKINTAKNYINILNNIKIESKYKLAPGLQRKYSLCWFNSFAQFFYTIKEIILFLVQQENKLSENLYLNNSIKFFKKMLNNSDDNINRAINDSSDYIVNNICPHIPGYKYSHFFDIYTNMTQILSALNEYPFLLDNYLNFTTIDINEYINKESPKNEIISKMLLEKEKYNICNLIELFNKDISYTIYKFLTIDCFIKLSLESLSDIETLIEKNDNVYSINISVLTKLNKYIIVKSSMNIDSKIIDNKIINQKINLYYYENNEIKYKKYELMSAIIFINNNHFITYVKYNNNWYQYDEETRKIVNQIENILTDKQIMVVLYKMVT